MLNEPLDLHARAAGGYRSLPPSILSISALLARALPRFPPPMRLPPSPPSQLPTDTAPARSGQLKSNRSRRSIGGPRAAHELRPNCVLAEHGAAAGRLVPPAVIPPPGRPQSRPSCQPPSSTPPPRGDLRARPRRPHPPPPGSGRAPLRPGPAVCSPGQCPGPRGAGPRSRGLRRRLRPSVPRPSVSPGSRGGAAGTRGAERTDLEVQRHLPGRRRRPAAPRARGEGAEAGGEEAPAARGVPAPLARSPPERRGPRVPSAGRGGA